MITDALGDLEKCVSLHCFPSSAFLVIWFFIFLEIGGHRRNSAGLVGAEDHRRRKESRRQRHGGTGNWNDGTAGVSHRGKKWVPKSSEGPSGSPAAAEGDDLFTKVSITHYDPNIPRIEEENRSEQFAHHIASTAIVILRQTGSTRRGRKCGHKNA